MRLVHSLILILLFSPLNASTKNVSDLANETAQYAANTYQQAMVDSLRQLVKYKTIAVEGVSALDNPEHIAFKNELAKQAKSLGLEYIDHGHVIIIALGKGEERVGVITHGDVQPVNPNKWSKSPFELDQTSEPGKLIARGTEDDKGPISTAMFAMKAIKDKNIPLTKRIELYVYMAEESDWDPIREFIKHNTLPQINITIDSEYPVVTAEKGWTLIKATFPENLVKTDKAYIAEFKGGAFASQIPEDASAVIHNADKKLLQKFKQNAANHSKINYSFKLEGHILTINARGKAAHSSTPEDGVNAITFLSDLLSIQRWPNTASGALVNFLNDHIGTGLYGKNFGDIAYQDSFMGPMTVSPTVLKQSNKGIELSINMRRPRGKEKAQLEKEIDAVLNNWQSKNNVRLLDIDKYIGDPYIQDNAPHLNTLLGVFSHFTGVKNPKPVSIGGGTNSRLFPNAVSFGPAMPGVEYTGHSEHEFITMDQFVLNLKMYTAVMIELAK